ncbi:DUF6686 family protein [Haliscomenobacter sp.]|uniref:DUF6686 family protein n=1 Tax=Haliscomenobacter sp. TaxID=2717303 RepID=UPI003593A558
MCDFRTLASSTLGIVCQCQQCKSISITFGTVSLSLKADEFERFCKTATSCLQYFKVKVETSKMKQIPFYQLTPTSMIVLSFEELEQLNRLLRKTQTKLLQLELANSFPYNPS